jgi:hypothetical protein
MPVHNELEGLLDAVEARHEISELVIARLRVRSRI